MTTETSTTTVTAELQEWDPRELLLDANARTAVNLTKQFVDSIRELGVLEPPIATRDTEADAPRVRMGQRRVLGAVEAGRDSVRVIVITGPTDDAVRLAEQLAENLHHEPMTTADVIAGIGQLFDLNVEAGRVRSITGLDRKVVDAARQVAHHEGAMAAARKHDQLGLDELLAFAEFDGDETATKMLTENAGARGFAHTVQSLRDRRDEAAARETATAAARKAGFTIVEHGGGAVSVWQLFDGDGKLLDEKAHAKTCPGRACMLVRDHSKDKITFRRVAHYCVKPELHKTHSGEAATAQSAGGTGGKMTPAQLAERRQVIDNNKAWKSATTVRRQWLAEFAGRKKPPADALAWVLECVARDDFSMTDTSAWKYNPDALAFLGVETAEQKHKYGEPATGLPEVLDLLAKAPRDRALVIACTLLLGAYERELQMGTWRNVNDTRKRYVQRLEAWGYPVSDVEQIVLTGKMDRHVHPDGTVTSLKADTAKLEAAKAAPAAPAEHGPAAEDGPHWPRIVGGVWADRLAEQDDPADETVAAPDGLDEPDVQAQARALADELVHDPDGRVLYHLAPNPDELDAAVIERG